MRYVCDGIVIYGSTARLGADPTRDIDMLCLADCRGSRSIQINYLGFDLDLLLTNVDIASSALREAVRGNENYILRALYQGHVLHDERGRMRELATEAAEVWVKGPSSPGDQEKGNISARAKKVLMAANRLIKKSLASESELRCRETQSSIWLDMLIKDFCRVHRLWNSSLCEHLINDDPGYAPLKEYLTAFMVAHSVTSRLRIISDIASNLLKHTSS